MFHILGYGEHCMQRACIHTKRSEYVSDLAICLRGWNFASGSMTIAGFIVTSCLLTKRNSIATVSITHTNLTCGQMGILSRLCKVTFNYVTLSVCGVEIWMISWLALSSSKIALLTGEMYPRLLQKDLHQIWRTCPWINEVVCKYTSNMTQNLLIFGMRLEIYLTIICLADGSGVVVPTICQLRF
jgi:hypothetical protein